MNVRKLPVTVPVPHNLSWSDFKILKTLKTSAAYRLFKANWNGQTVVVKLLLDDEDGPRNGAQKELTKEINILSRLQHPNIIKLLGSGHEPRHFAVLEFLGGGTLSQKLNYTYKDNRHYGKDTLPKNLVFEYALKLADALAYMHERWHPGIRLFHRDLKSDNVGFTESGELKLFDFGLAELIRRTIREDVLFPLPGGVGSWRYMAPEVILRQPYNHKSDVYSYSFILYHMLVGRHPIRNSMNLTMLKRVVIENHWRPKIPPYWPMKLYRLLTRSWSTDIMVRPNFLDIVGELKELIAEGNFEIDVPPKEGVVQGLIHFVE